MVHKTHRIYPKRNFKTITYKINIYIYMFFAVNTENTVQGKTKEHKSKTKYGNIKINYFLFHSSKINFPVSSSLTNHGIGETKEATGGVL